MRFLVALAIVLGALALIEAGFEMRDAARRPRAGRIVRVDGRVMHLIEAGQGHDGPTVVLECGIGGATASDWAWVERGVSMYAHVVAYDRAGMGLSAAGPQPRDGLRTTGELHAMLLAAGIPGPYVFVGHSYGGLLARIFVERYPGDVTGVVLLESSHPRQFAVFHPGPVHVITTLLPVTPWLARIGLMRVVISVRGIGEADQLPRDARRTRAMDMSSAHQWDGLVSEMLVWRTLTSPEAGRTHGFGDRPLVAVSGGASVHGRPEWLALQAEGARLSTNAVHGIEPGASHGGLLSDSTHAVHVVEAIRVAWEAARTGGRVTMPAGLQPLYDSNGPR